MRRSLSLLLLALVGALLPSAPAVAADPPGTLRTITRSLDLRAVGDAGDGALLIAARGLIARLDQSGELRVVAGTGRPCHDFAACPDGPAQLTGVNPFAVTGDPRSGAVYFVEVDLDGQHARIRRILDGQITSVTDPSGETCRTECGNGGPASAARLAAAKGMGVGPDGSLYFGGASEVRRIAPDGRITAVAGSGESCSGEDVHRPGSCGDGGPATSARINLEGGIAVARDGRIAVVDQDRVRIVEGGVIRTLAGDGIRCFGPDPCGDGTRRARFGMAIAAEFDDAGNLYVGENQGSGRVRRIAPDGTVETVAGSYVHCDIPAGDDCGEGRSAQLGRMRSSTGSVAVAGNDLYALTENRLVRVNEVTQAPILPKQRYRFLAADGGVFNFGWAPFHGSTGGMRLNQPIVGGDATGADGYFLVAADGGIFTFGDARFHGSAVGRTRSPVTGLAVTPDNAGYWVLEASGAVHAFGSARDLGRAAGPPGARAVGMAADPDGEGYWVAFDNGAVRAVGATDHGSAVRPNRPIVGITGRAGGYWLVASDGGVFAFGRAAFRGSTGAIRLNRPVLGMVTTPTHDGYWLIAADGGVFTFGDAQFHGSMGGTRLNRPVVAAMAG